MNKISFCDDNRGAKSFLVAEINYSGTEIYLYSGQKKARNVFLFTFVI